MTQYTTRVCPRCSKEFRIGTSPSVLANRKFCSRACQNSARHSSASQSLKIEWVDVDMTIQTFGYNPTDLYAKSRNKIIAICQQCHSRRVIACSGLTEICRNCTNGNISRKRDHSSFTLLPSHIDIKATIKQFGYDPCFLAKGSQKQVVAHCYICKKSRIVKMQSAMKHPACLECSFNDPMSTKNRSQAQLDMNRKGKWKMSEETKRKISQAHIERIASGKGNHGKGQWFYRETNEWVYLRSSYELGTALFLEVNNIEWQYEPKPFTLTILQNGKSKQTSYKPDFYLPEYDTYIEVKGYWYRQSKIKFEAFLNQYPEIDIQVWDKSIMRLLGVID